MRKQKEERRNTEKRTTKGLEKIFITLIAFIAFTLFTLCSYLCFLLSSFSFLLSKQIAETLQPPRLTQSIKMLPVEPRGEPPT